jgi:hypothetical protein
VVFTLLTQGNQMQHSDVYFLAERALETLEDVRQSISRAIEVNDDRFTNELLTVAETNITIARMKLNVVKDVAK